jgi:hypothetical protein
VQGRWLITESSQGGSALLCAPSARAHGGRERPKMGESSGRGRAPRDKDGARKQRGKNAAGKAHKELQRHSVARTAKQGESQGLQLGSGTFTPQSRRVLDSSSERSTPTAARRAANAGRVARVPLCAHRRHEDKAGPGRGGPQRRVAGQQETMTHATMARREAAGAKPSSARTLDGGRTATQQAMAESDTEWHDRAHMALHRLSVAGTSGASSYI